jgi:hypothetical protein
MHTSLQQKNKVTKQLIKYLTPWNTVLLETITVPELVREFPHFMDKRISTAPTRLYPEPD